MVSVIEGRRASVVCAHLSSNWCVTWGYRVGREKFSSARRTLCDILILPSSFLQHWICSVQSSMPLRHGSITFTKFHGRNPTICMNDQDTRHLMVWLAFHIAVTTIETCHRLTVRTSTVWSSQILSKRQCFCVHNCAALSLRRTPSQTSTSYEYTMHKSFWQPVYLLLSHT